MRILLLIGFVCVVFASCKKDDSNVEKKNSWKLGTVTYTVNRYTRTTTDFQAFDEAGNGIIFSFATFPTADGAYKVVGNSAPLASNEVLVIAVQNSSGASFFTKGNDQRIATVKVVSPTRLEVSMQSSWSYRSASDSLKLSANVGEL